MDLGFPSLSFPPQFLFPSSASSIPFLSFPLFHCPIPPLKTNTKKRPAGRQNRMIAVISQLLSAKWIHCNFFAVGCSKYIKEWLLQIKRYQKASTCWEQTNSSSARKEKLDQLVKSQRFHLLPLQVYSHKDTALMKCLHFIITAARRYKNKRLSRLLLQL